MKINELRSWISIFAFIALLIIIMPGKVKADELNSNSSNLPVVAIGNSLTSSQKKATIKTLTASLNGADYQTITVTGSDLVKYLNPSDDNFTTSSGVWSSAMIQKTSDGGINVKILPFNGQYNIVSNL